MRGMAFPPSTPLMWGVRGGGLALLRVWDAEQCLPGNGQEPLRTPRHRAQHRLLSGHRERVRHQSVARLPRGLNAGTGAAGQTGAPFT